MVRRSRCCFLHPAGRLTSPLAGRTTLMPIQLIDIPQAVADYLNDEVLTFVEDFDGTLSPGEDKQGGVLVLNGDTTPALRLINLRLHLQIEPRPGGDPDPDDPDAAENARKVARLIA